LFYRNKQGIFTFNDVINPIKMNKIYLVLPVFLLTMLHGQSQLTVTAFANTPTICAGGSTQITASATPVSYTVSTIPLNMSFDADLNVLANAGVAVTPTSSGSTLDDCRWDNIALPFSFRFFGNLYSTIHICSNGWIGMGGVGSTNTGMGFSLPNATSPNNVIHGVTADLDLRGASGGKLEYYDEGSFPNRVFVVSYQNVLFRTGGGTTTFQIKLYENGNIVEIHTSAAGNTTLGKAQGVENAAGTAANTVTGRNNTTTWSGFTSGYRFTPDVINFSWSPPAGLSSTTGATVTASPAMTTIYTVTATNASSGATGNITTTITIDPASYTLAGTATPGGTAICQNKSVAGSTDYRDGNCNLIANILPSGASPVSNVVNSCVRVDTGATKKGTIDLYLARNYDIEPQINAATATATVTLFFLQSEFNKFNLRAADSGHKLLPTGPADATGIANLVLRQFHGTGTKPGNYTTGTFDDFTTATAGVSVSWNATRNWWEVTIPVTGFSGFYITSKKSAPVPITLEYFKGNRQGNVHNTEWKVTCTSTQVTFEIERSGDARTFASIHSLTATQARCLQAFNFTDASPLGGINYYRLKMIDVDGKVSYSGTISMLNKESKFDILSVVPTLVQTTAYVNIAATANSRMDIVITDLSGRQVQKQTISLVPGSNQVTLNVGKLAPGMYQVSGYTVDGMSKTVRFVKQ
jgi:hypothetical protein